MSARKKDEEKKEEKMLEPGSIEALRSSNELFTLFMRHSPVYAYIKAVTPTESRIMQASDNYKQMLGMSNLDIVGKTTAELFPPEFASKITADDWVAFANGNVLILDKYMNDRSYITIKFPFVHGDKNILAGYIVDVTVHEEAEKALRAGEENFRRCQDDSPLGICIVTADGEILYANRTILDMYGYDSVEDIKATSLQENYDPESYAEHRVREEKRRRGEHVPPNYEIDVVRKDGQGRRFEVFQKEVLWNGEAQVEFFYNDITERKRVEEKLREEEGALRAGEEKLRDDREALRAEEGKLQKGEEALRAETDSLRACEEALRAETDSLGAGVDRLRQERETLQSSEEKLRAEEEKLRNDRDVLRAGEEKLRDDREALRAEAEKLREGREALRAEEEKLRILFENVGAAVTVTDMKGKIIDVNKAWLELSGYIDRTEVIGRNRIDLISEKDRDKITQELADTGTVGTGVSAEITMLRKDGSEYLCEASNTVMCDAAGNAVGVVYVDRNITNRRTAEKAVLASLEGKEILLREAHNHAKNDLDAVITLLEIQRKMLAKPMGRPGMTPAAISTLENRVKSMALVHGRLSKSQNIPYIDSQDYLSALVSHLRTSLDAPTEILCSVNAAGIAMKLDTAVPVGMIVNELATNALKYAFPDNKPCYGADRCEITISLERKNAEYTLIVDDNGVGLPKDFSLAKTSTLGLHLVRMLGVDQLGGKLALNRTRGTRFVLRFKVKE